MKPDAAPGRYRRPPLYERQRAAIFHDDCYGWIEASTNSGKTYAALAWLTEQALIHGRPGRNYWWVAPIFGQAEIAYRRLKRALPRALYKPQEARLAVKLGNHAVLWFKSGEHPDGLYGEDVYAAVIDEASRVREESWHAVRTTLTATRGPIRWIGNVKGKKNWFYRRARRAESGLPNHRYSRISAHDAVEAGVLSAEAIEDARRELPQHVFRELYLAEAPDDTSNPFGTDAIRACAAPLSAKPPVAWGWDLAKSVDWTVGIALDADGRACRFERWQGVPWGDTVRRIHAATGSVPALVDSTGLGDPIVERLQQEAASAYEGFSFSARSKQQLMEGLAAAIQAGEIGFPDGPIASELAEFEYHYTATGVRYSAPEGLHDDCVCALALAWRKLSQPVIRWGAVPAA